MLFIYLTGKQIIAVYTICLISQEVKAVRQLRNLGN